MSSPSKITRPAVGATSPEMSLKKVLLPAPLGPMIERSSPAATGEVDGAHGHQAPETPRELLGTQEGVRHGRVQ
jgi:hypothetical protein